jgi:hypothetical protein
MIPRWQSKTSRYVGGVPARAAAGYCFPSLSGSISKPPPKMQISLDHREFINPPLNDS